MSSQKSFSCDPRAASVLGLASEVLHEGIMTIEAESLKLSENFETGVAKIEAKIIEIRGASIKKHNVKGEGVGLVDALFDAMIRAYEDCYSSLSAISIVDFRINAHIDRGSCRQSDAHVTASLNVKNALDQEYTFECTTPSISHSSIAVVHGSIAFFINAEMAFQCLYQALEDAQKRGRHDLVERFRNQMAVVVDAIPYESLVAKLKAMQSKKG